MRNSGVFGALLFALLLSTGCRGVFSSGEPEPFDWQQNPRLTRSNVAAKPLANVLDRKSQSTDLPVRPVSHIAASVTIPDDYLTDPPPTPPTEDALAGLVRRRPERTRPRALPTAFEAEPIEPDERVEARPSVSRSVERSIASGGAQIRWKESDQSKPAPRMLEPSFDAPPTTEDWDELPDDSDANPLRSADDRPVVSAARWTYDRSDAQPNPRLRANPLRP